MIMVIIMIMVAATDDGDDTNIYSQSLHLPVTSSLAFPHYIIFQRITYIAIQLSHLFIVGMKHKM